MIDLTSIRMNTEHRNLVLIRNLIGALCARGVTNRVLLRAESKHTNSDLSNASQNTGIFTFFGHDINSDGLIAWCVID